MGSSSKTQSKRIYKKSEGEYYSYQWWGFICPTKSGNYQFKTNSDDASFVYINNFMVVDNRGLHGPQVRTGSVSLSTSCHEINIYFGEKTGGDVMDFQFKLPGENVWNKDLTEIFSSTKTENGENSQTKKNKTKKKKNKTKKKKNKGKKNKGKKKNKEKKNNRKKKVELASVGEIVSNYWECVVAVLVLLNLLFIVLYMQYAKQFCKSSEEIEANVALLSK